MAKSVTKSTTPVEPVIETLAVEPAVEETVAVETVAEPTVEISEAANLVAEPAAEPVVEELAPTEVAKVHVPHEPTPLHVMSHNGSGF